MSDKKPADQQLPPTAAEVALQQDEQRKLMEETMRKQANMRALATALRQHGQAK